MDPVIRESDTQVVTRQCSANGAIPLAYGSGGNKIYKYVRVGVRYTHAFDLMV